MSVGLIIFLILLGILLFLVEFMILPGVTVAGIGGAVSMVAAVILAFYYYGTSAGFIVLLATSVLIIGTVILMLKSGTWKKVMLTRKIDAKVDLIHSEEGKIKVGDRGLTVSRLNPMGKVMINGEYYQALSQGNYVDQNIEIEIIRIESNKLIVKPVN